MKKTVLLLLFGAILFLILVQTKPYTVYCFTIPAEYHQKLTEYIS